MARRICMQADFSAPSACVLRACARRGANLGLIWDYYPQLGLWEVWGCATGTWARLRRAHGFADWGGRGMFAGVETPACRCGASCTLELPSGPGRAEFLAAKDRLRSICSSPRGWSFRWSGRNRRRRSHCGGWARRRGRCNAIWRTDCAGAAANCAYAGTLFLTEPHSRRDCLC